jgi:hypothetical protein
VEGPSPRLRHPLQPMGPSAAEETQNRGNEAKKSLKTNEVSQTICAKRTHSCARKAPNEAKKEGSGCKTPRSSCCRTMREKWIRCRRAREATYHRSQSAIDDRQSSIK